MCTYVLDFPHLGDWVLPSYLIHELSHASFNGNTEDYTYTDMQALAASSPDQAAGNANNYAWYVWDVFVADRTGVLPETGDGNKGVQESDLGLVRF